MSAAFNIMMSYIEKRQNLPSQSTSFLRAEKSQIDKKSPMNSILTSQTLVLN